ncbi:MAG: hypothetical protein H8D26_04725 [Methanomicrobia archaeon]|nr:hypothetical protein [Methanomicrobia archaeon]
MQTTLLCAFCKQPPKQKGHYSRVNAEIEMDIEEKRETIAELKKEIKDPEQEILDAEKFELDFEPEEGEEVLYPCDCIVPTLEEDFRTLKYDNESLIRTFKEEIRNREKKLK